MASFTITFDNKHNARVKNALEGKYARPSGLTDIQFGQYCVKLWLKSVVFEHERTVAKVQASNGVSQIPEQDFS